MTQDFDRISVADVATDADATSFEAELLSIEGVYIDKGGVFLTNPQQAITTSPTAKDFLDFVRKYATAYNVIIIYKLPAGNGLSNYYLLDAHIGKRVTVSNVNPSA